MTTALGSRAVPLREATIAEPHVALAGISKRFGGAQALSDVSLQIRRGAVHALVGENGAGKSTLGKIIAGVHTPDAGELRVGGRPVSYRSPADALADGVTIIAQELALLPTRSVRENVFLGIEPRRGLLIDSKRLRAQFAELTERVGFSLSGSTLVRSLRVAEQQKVEILRALARGAELIVMDEPTAALTADEAGKLLDIVRGLREHGTTVVYVSHFLEEVLAIADVVTVLKDGRTIRTSEAADETPGRLVEAMLGRSLDLAFPAKQPPGADAPAVLTVDGLTRAGAIADVSLEIRAGEIVGMAGLIGSGRSEVARAIFAADHRDGGRIAVDGREIDPRSPRDAIRAGIALLPESRKDQGLAMRRPIVENVTLAALPQVTRAGVVRRGVERRGAAGLLGRLDVRTKKPRAAVSTLSGGNQQKVLFAKWLFRAPRILIADEPTRGVDVGAKRAIYELIVSLARDGMAVLLISSELEEVLGLSHRVLVMRGGQIAAELPGTATQDEVMSAAFELNGDGEGAAA